MPYRLLDNASGAVAGPLSDAGDADPAFLIPLPGNVQPLAPDQASRGAPGAGAEAHTGPGGEYRTICFGEAAVADLVGPLGQPLGRLLIQGGTRLRARVRWAGGAQAEAADLLFEDGSAARRVPRAAFTPEAWAPEAGTLAGDGGPRP